jgi:hypothetical protein
MDAYKKLKKIFPEANSETDLIVLSPSTQLRLGKTRIELAPYQVDDNQYVYAAFSKERNEIYVRLVDFSEE